MLYYYNAFRQLLKNEIFINTLACIIDTASWLPALLSWQPAMLDDRRLYTSHFI